MSTNVISADVIKELVPFGIVGLAIVAVVAIFLGLRAGNWLKFVIALLAIVAIAGLAIFDKITPVGSAVWISTNEHSVEETTI